MNRYLFCMIKLFFATFFCDVICDFIKKPSERPVTAGLLRERCLDAIGLWVEKQGEMLQGAGALQHETIQLTRAYVQNQKDSLLIRLNDKDRLQNLLESYTNLICAADMYKKAIDSHITLLKAL